MPKVMKCQNTKGPNRLCREECSTCLERSFAQHHRAIHWSTKNTITPRDVDKASDKRFIFKCDDCPHEFEMSIRKVTRLIQWCPYCANRSRCTDNNCMFCFHNSFASHPKSALWSINNIKEPREIAKSDNKKYKFDCPDCQHTFETSPNRIQSGSSCSYCTNQALCDVPLCRHCSPKSYASRPQSKYWSKKNRLLPHQVHISSKKEFMFDCTKCSHQYFSVPARNAGCPYCSHARLCSRTECDFCYKKSFASNSRSKYLHASNILEPRALFLYSNKKVMFDCDTCIHAFWSSPADVSSNHWCPYCAHRKLCNNSECQDCYSKSMASYEAAKFWSSSNTQKAREVFRGSDMKYNFDCHSCKKIFSASPNNITGLRTWCPLCKNKTEGKLWNWLQVNHFVVETQKTFAWTKTTTSYRRYDFYITSLKILIELDGPQHFEQIQNWRSPEATNLVDRQKNSLSLENGQHIIRICQKAVWLDKEDWESKLIDTIKMLEIEDQPRIVCIGKVYKSLNFSSDTIFV